VRTASFIAFATVLTVMTLPASAGQATPQTVFGLEYRQQIDQRCDGARKIADTIADHGSDVSAGYAHLASRAFLDCAGMGPVMQDRLNRYFLMAGATELIAAQHETGDAAVASRHNAIDILTPLIADPQLSVNEGYRDAPPSLGDAAIVPVVRDFGPYQPHRAPSILAPIATELIDEARAGLPPPTPAPK
jgi:hypothetical protein